MIENKNYTEVKKLINNLVNKTSDGKYVFRGIDEIYNKDEEISSSLFRKHEENQVWNMYFSPKQAEKEIVEKAKRLFPPNTSNIEILTDLRHYDGKVNFIDFTYDLYIALFFACSGKMDKQGQLVMLKTNNIDIIKDIDYEKNRHKVTIIEPAKTDTSWNRVITQKSVFVYSPEGYIPKNQCIIEPIRMEDKQIIKDYLKKFHYISANTIYNDLIGFIDNEENYVSAYVEFYKGLSLWEEAKAKNKTEKYQEAINTYSKTIELKPDLHVAYFNRGLAKNELKQYKGAITDYNKAIELEPDDAGAYYMRGIAKDQLKQYNEAVIDFNEAIELEPDDVGAYYNRGITKYKLKKYNEAIIDFNKAVELKPDDAEIYYNRGIAKNELKQYNEAITDFNKSIELEPDDAGTYYMRGITKYELKQYNEAITDFNKAIELKPNDTETYYNRGVAKSKLGQYKEAVIDLKKAIQLDPNLESKLRPIINELKNKLKKKK